jgi:hypothetical protein
VVQAVARLLHPSAPLPVRQAVSQLFTVLADRGLCDRLVAARLVEELVAVAPRLEEDNNVAAITMAWLCRRHAGVRNRCIQLGVLARLEQATLSHAKLAAAAADRGDRATAAMHTTAADKATALAKVLKAGVLTGPPLTSGSGSAAAASSTSAAAASSGTAASSGGIPSAPSTDAPRRVFLTSALPVYGRGAGAPAATAAAAASTSGSTSGTSGSTSGTSGSTSGTSGSTSGTSGSTSGTSGSTSGTSGTTSGTSASPHAVILGRTLGTTAASSAPSPPLTRSVNLSLPVVSYLSKNKH